MYTWMPLKSSADLAQLEQILAPEYNPRAVSQKLMNGLSNAIKAVMVEENYIDKDYRSTFYNFYSKKGLHYLSECVRLHFFDEMVGFEEATLRLTWPDQRLEDHYFGYMVLRPTGIATIGRRRPGYPQTCGTVRGVHGYGPSQSALVGIQAESPRIPLYGSAR